MENFIGIQKNQAECVRVYWSEFKGKKSLHVRTFVNTDDGPSPTKKGITLGHEQARALIEALEAKLLEE